MRSLQDDSGLGIPFPGEVLPRERWTRTRVGLGGGGRHFDWTATFGRSVPRVVDLGCGNGRYLIASALARAGLDHLGKKGSTAWTTRVGEAPC